MPVKRRWALNPRKWFGTSSHAAQRREKISQLVDYTIQLPPQVTKPTRTMTQTAIVPRILTSKSKTKITPVLPVNDSTNFYVSSTNTFGSFVQFQTPSFNTRREKTMGSFHPTSTFVSTTRKNGRSKEEISMNAPRKSVEKISCDTSKLVKSSLQHGNPLIQQSSIGKQSEMNISNLSDRDLIECHRDISHDFTKASLLPRRSHSSSSLSIDDNDTRDESSSSGVFTDERADTNDRHRKASKDTLSTLEVLSVESIADSQTSFHHDQSRPLPRRYRLPLLSMETVENKSTRSPTEQSVVHSYRAYSAENLLKDAPIVVPVTPRTRQSSAAIAKKIEKRNLAAQSPTAPLEKVAFVRVANDTYRLTIEKEDHLYRRQRPNSVVQYSDNEDSLPPAEDEESYATLPRTSSTDQLNNSLQDDVRAIVDDYLRPVAASMTKKTSQSTKSLHRSKRSQMNNEQTQINIDHITDKLLSSVACSTYSQYQRCY